MEKYRPLYIDGKWVEPASGKKAQVINPANEEIIGEFALGTVEDVNKAVAAAKKVFDEEWFNSTPGERAAVLLKIADIFEKNADEFAMLEALQAGKPIEAAISEIPIIADVYRFYAGMARTCEGMTAQDFEKGYTGIIRREPLGVTAGICPWNYPLLMMAWKIAPALAAGNTSVIKPASDTPLTALLFAEKISGIIPDGLINIVTGAGSEIGGALCRHPDISLISLTGDTATGRKIAEQCAGTLKRVHLELGGKAPLIVFDDCDLDVLLEVMTGAATPYYNTGQDCGQPCRFIVQSGIYDKVVKAMAEHAAKLKVGDTLDPETEMGPVISRKQLNKIAAMVDNALKSGAELIIGGHIIDRKGFYYEPTVLAVEDQKSEIIQKEVFGPVITVQKFDTETEALAMANDVIYGLGSGIWTGDAKRSLRMSRNLKCGTVWVNTYRTETSERPWGGYKQSGYGKDLSKYALDDYTQIKNVVLAYE